jgi:ABC-2 type transport system permease protein
MSPQSRFAPLRFWGIVCKEFLQLRRDRLTFAMMVAVPIVQMALFGFAINSDPKHLPTAVVAADQSEFTRSLVAAMRNSSYFNVVANISDEDSAGKALARGTVQFVLNVPVNFTHDLARGLHPSLLMEADATDPAAVGNALATLPMIVQQVLQRDLTGGLSRLTTSPAAFDIQVHRLYNPEGITQYNIVPGIMGVILTMTLVMMTGLAITRERERGTMENLLAMPVRPIEVMAGKMVPYVGIGLVQVTIILLVGRYVFNVPFVGGVTEIYAAALLFVATTLAVGVTLSSLAQNQLQAVQLAVFYFLPSILMSGFMFPFAGMPRWAQIIGNLLPLTYFNRLIRGILLKGNSLPDLLPDTWPLVVILMVVITIAVRFYRRTLD